MNHIELALSVLRKEVEKLDWELKRGSRDPSPNDEEEAKRKIQKLNHAINVINDTFYKEMI